MLIHLRNENVVSIYPFVPLLGFFAGSISFCFCLGLVLVPYLTDYQSGGVGLSFISEGMNFNCGWSSAILGSTGMFVGFCEMTAALHTDNSKTYSLIIAILIQAPAWCILVGVSGTGWGIHYGALVCFTLSTFYFHWMFAGTHPLASNTKYYHATNLLTALNLVSFFMAFIILRATEVDPSSSTNAIRVIKDITVSLELTLLCCITSQTFCLSWVLLQYKNIHILFEDDYDDNKNKNILHHPHAQATTSAAFIAF